MKAGSISICSSRVTRTITIRTIPKRLWRRWLALCGNGLGQATGKTHPRRRTFLRRNTAGLARYPATLTWRRF
ncbi:MAG: hypothetical protein MZV63_58050 [Marinilabiliales bacterium]|nr:hypothetical protein [Marinilabiliales bacterium]